MSGETPTVELTGGAASAQRALDAAIDALQAGGVVLLPTDTMYGLACLPSWTAAIARIYEMKHRPHDLRLPIIVGDERHAEAELPLRWTPGARTLADAFWPGALTIVFGIEQSPVAGSPSATRWGCGRRHTTSSQTSRAPSARFS